jgi:hypothetical protein
VGDHLPSKREDQSLNLSITKNRKIKTEPEAGCLWLTHVILDTWEAEIGRITVQGQPGQIVQETPPHLQNNQSKIN